MIRIGNIRSAQLRAMSLAGAALLTLAVARPALAQETPPAAPAQEDILKFSSSAAPALILFQITAEKTADFESAWGMLKEAFAKVTDADAKAFGDTLNKLYKLDQPPIDTPGGKAVIYVLQLDSPSTTHSYNPVKIIYETLWKNGAEGAPLKREEADAIYKKIEGKVFQNISPWKLAKVG